MNENQNEYVDINAHDNYPDSEQKIEIPTMKVIPLKKICMTIGALPTSYLETLSYYEMLVWFIEFLKNNIIPTINNNASAIQEVQSVVLALQEYINNYKDSIDSDVEELEEYMNNYFENLDVQEEINNKLDDMLKDGVLEQIIEQFLQLTSLICFDNVADMKSSVNLANGSYAKTLGYYSKNDGGSATYKIRNITNDDVVDNMFIIEMNDNNLIAELIIDDELYVEKLGVKGDGTSDDTLIIQSGINYCITNGKVLKSLGGKSFLITESLNINNRIDIDFNGSEIITNSNIDMIIFNYASGEEYQGYLKNIVINMNNVAGIGIHCIRVVKKTISEIVIKNITNIGYQMDLGHEVIFQNSHLYGSSSTPNSVGLRLLKGDCHYKDLIMIDVHNAIWSSSTNFYTRIHAWIKTTSLIPDSIFMKCDSPSTHFLNQCYSDTYGYSFYISNGSRLKLSEHYNNNNQTIMTPESITANGGHIYMFYYTNTEYSRYTTISNSRLQGYPDNSSLARYTNLNYDEILSFVDSLTYVNAWSDNFKNGYITITANEINGTDFDIVSSYANKFIVNGCTITLNLKVQANKFIAAGTTTKIGTLPQKYIPQTETVFVVPTSLTAYGLKHLAMIYILTNGDIYYNSNEDTNSYDIIMINHTYITINNQP